MTATKYKRERFQLGDDIRYRCTNCGKIKKPNKFGKQSRARWGLSPQCLVCINEKRNEKKTPEQRKALAKKSRDAARKKAAIARAADAKYENWLWRQEQGLKVPLGKPGWSKHSDCCLQCGTFFHPHHGKGLCHKCYARDYQGSKAHPFNREGKWSRLYDHCIECGQSDRRHAGHGVCVKCRWYNHAKPVPERDCAHCGERIQQSKFATKRRYCNQTCARRAYWERRRQREQQVDMFVVDQEAVVAVERATGQAVLPLTG